MLYIEIIKVMDLDVLPNAQCTQFHGKWAEKDRNFGVTLMIEPVFMRATREGVKIMVVAVGVVEIFHGDGDAGVRRLERGNEGIDGVSIAPAADRVGPERDVDGFRSGSGVSLSRCGVGSGCSGLAAGAQGKYHAQREQHCEQFLHDVPP